VEVSNLEGSIAAVIPAGSRCGSAGSGGGLDVFEAEPLPANEPLAVLDNVILTPHEFASTTDV
jgi:D-isomer specific 2-hydroxyacid dehydrogenase, NAD binding domain